MSKSFSAKVDQWLIVLHRALRENAVLIYYGFGPPSGTLLLSQTFCNKVLHNLGKSLVISISSKCLDEDKWKPY